MVVPGIGPRISAVREGEQMRLPGVGELKAEEVHFMGWSSVMEHVWNCAWPSTQTQG